MCVWHLENTQFFQLVAVGTRQAAEHVDDYMSCSDGVLARDGKRSDKSSAKAPEPGFAAEVWQRIHGTRNAESKTTPVFVHGRPDLASLELKKESLGNNNKMILSVRLI